MIAAVLRPALIRCFEEAAWVAGGELEIQPGSGDSREIPILAATVEGVRVEATIERAGLGQFFRTLINAPARGALGLSLSVWRGSGHRLTTGDPRFDGDYAVQSNDEAYARLWLDAHVRRRLLDAHRAYAPGRFTFQLDGEQASAARRGLEEDPDALVRAIDVVAALAARGRRLLGDWRTLADAIGGEVIAQGTWRPDTRARIEARPAGSRVVVDSMHGAIPDAGGGRFLVTRVSCARAETEPDAFALVNRSPDNVVRPELPRARLEIAPSELELATHYRVTCERRERTLARLDETASELIRAARPAAILANPSQVSVLFEGFEHTPERIGDAMTLARQLAVRIEGVGLAGPYR